MRAGIRHHRQTARVEVAAGRGVVVVVGDGVDLRGVAVVGVSYSTDGGVSGAGYHPGVVVVDGVSWTSFVDDDDDVVVEWWKRERQLVACAACFADVVRWRHSPL